MLRHHWIVSDPKLLALAWGSSPPSAKLHQKRPQPPNSYSEPWWLWRRYRKSHMLGHILGCPLTSVVTTFNFFFFWNNCRVTGYGTKVHCSFSQIPGSHTGHHSVLFNRGNNSLLWPGVWHRNKTCWVFWYLRAHNLGVTETESLHPNGDPPCDHELALATACFPSLILPCQECSAHEFLQWRVFGAWLALAWCTTNWDLTELSHVFMFRSWVLLGSAPVWSSLGQCFWAILLSSPPE